MNSDFNLGVRGDWAAGATKIGASSNAPRHLNAKAILFLAQKDEKTMMNEALRINQSCGSRKVSCANFTAAGKDLPAEIRRLRSEGYIGDDTHLVINFHGEKQGGEHFMGDGVKTLDVVDAIRRPLENGKPCSATVYIMSCYAGGQKLRRDLQEIHNKYASGVCFLLSSAARTMSTTCSAAMDEVIAEVAHAEATGAPVSSMQIFARMGISRSDCMTMIEANRGAPLIMHAPKHVADLGRAGLRANIENGTVIIPEKSVHSGAYVYFPEQDDLQCARGDDLDGEPVGKKMVEGDDSSVERLKEEVEKSGEATDPSLVRRRTLDRRAMPGGLDHMTEFLVGDEAWEGAKDNQWNEHHSRILDLIMFASLDEDTFRRDSKMEYLVHLCSDAVNSISQLEARSICNRLVGFPVALDSLVERDFFLFADADAPASRKMEAVCMHLMRGSASAEQIKSFLERNVHFKNELSDAEINGSHSLVVEMLETVAVGAADRSKFLREYLVELLSAQQHLFSAPENGKWIAEMDTKYAAAAALLRDIGVFDALPVHSDEEANSDLGVSEAGIHNADVEDISIEDRMNQALALARNASAGDVGEYLDGFAYWKEGFAQEEFNDCHLLIIRMLDVSVENRDSFVTTSLLQILDAKATLIRREEVVEVVQRFSRAYHRLEMDDFFR